MTDIWIWSEWLDRQQVTGLDAKDVGIDLVAQRRNVGYAAIQCKFRKASGNVRKDEIDSFLGSSAGFIGFDLCWLVVNRPLSKALQKYIDGRTPPLQVINLYSY